MYCVSHFGVTGAPGEEWDTGNVLRSLREMTDLPLAVGFGISSVEKAISAGRAADGVIVGSWLIEELEVSADKADTAAKFTRTLKRALRGDDGER